MQLSASGNHDFQSLEYQPFVTVQQSYPE
jgi:hypothetical protein